MQKLFAVYLGGYSPHCNLELHDVVFVVGSDIESTYPALIKKWYMPTYDRLHYDGYADLSVVDGHRVTLSPSSTEQDVHLYFVHLGGYSPLQLGELHFTCFVVAKNKGEASTRAKAIWEGSDIDLKHKDTLKDVESCICIEDVDGHHIALAPTNDLPNTDYHAGYHLIPKSLLESHQP